MYGFWCHSGYALIHSHAGHNHHYLLLLKSNIICELKKIALSSYPTNTQKLVGNEILNEVFLFLCDWAKCNFPEPILSFTPPMSKTRSYCSNTPNRMNDLQFPLLYLNVCCQLIIPVKNVQIMPMERLAAERNCKFYYTKRN